MIKTQDIYKYFIKGIQHPKQVEAYEELECFHTVIPFI